jgi:cytosine deaminase
MHIDEHLDPERILFDAIIERTRAHGMQGRVVAGHCCALSAIEQDEAKRIIEGFAEAEIGVVTLPAANLFLQGRDKPPAAAGAHPSDGVYRGRGPASCCF